MFFLILYYPPRVIHLSLFQIEWKFWEREREREKGHNRPLLIPAISYFWCIKRENSEIKLSCISLNFYKNLAPKARSRNWNRDNSWKVFFGAKTSHTLSWWKAGQITCCCGKKIWEMNMQVLSTCASRIQFKILNLLCTGHYTEYQKIWKWLC